MNNKILLLGSGYVSVSVLEYFKLFSDKYYLTVASNNLEEATKLCSKYNNANPTYLDVNNDDIIEKLVQQNDIVISLVPYTLHVLVAKKCIKFGKNMVTASYISPALKELDTECLNKNITILNEVGLDPGIDHLAVYSVKSKVESEGGEIKKFYSYCGGLTAPDAEPNPFGYKFSWSPEGVLRAINNNSKFLKDSKIVEVNSNDLLYSSQKFNISNALNLVGYPNRDSVIYKDIYKLDKAETLIRGTLRFQGFCEIIPTFREFRLLTEEKFENEKYNNIFEYIESQLNDSDLKRFKQLEGDKIVSQFGDINIYFRNSETIKMKFFGRIMKNKYWENITLEQRKSRMLIVFQGYHYLGIFDKVNNFQINYDNKLMTCSNILKSKLTMNKNDKDFIVMFHYFEVLYPKTNRKKYIKSFLYKTGELNGMSAMAITVGYPAAISAKLILEGAINTKGVIGPFSSDICEPIIKELSQFGLTCKEEEFNFDPKI